MKHEPKAQFVLKLAKRLVNLTEEQAEKIAVEIWQYTNNEWSDGYSRGIHGYQRDRENLVELFPTKAD